MPLLCCHDFMKLMKLLRDECPKIKMGKKQQLVSIYTDVAELQRDLCAQVNLERSEASRGLTLDYFKVALQRAMPSGWHTKLAAGTFQKFAKPKGMSRAHES